MNDGDLQHIILAHIKKALRDDSDKDVPRIIHPDRKTMEPPSGEERMRILSAIPGQVTALADGCGHGLQAVIDGLAVEMRGETVYGLLRKCGAIPLSANMPEKVCSQCGAPIEAVGGGYTCDNCDDGRILCGRCAHQCDICGRMACDSHVHADERHTYCADHRCADVECDECRAYMTFMEDSQ